jgi:predicted regulator of Ras-like GTPase activity (Roadblock/LC7/MglB family)
MTANVTTTLKDVLGDLVRKGGVVAALVVSRDGFLIDGVKTEEVDLDALGALTSSALLAWEAVGNEMAVGAPESLLAEFEAGPVAASPVNPDAVLVLLGNRLCNLGRIKIEIQRARQQVAACL